MKLRRAFADANKIVRRSMDFRYIGELTEKRDLEDHIGKESGNFSRVSVCRKNAI